MNAKKALKIEWEPLKIKTSERKNLRAYRNISIFLQVWRHRTHKAKIAEIYKTRQIVRKDCDPETAFKNAAKVIERTFTAPFLRTTCRNR
jgi:isoquinoline 1-oxidoreductase beta subunit